MRQFTHIFVICMVFSGLCAACQDDPQVDPPQINDMPTDLADMSDQTDQSPDMVDAQPDLMDMTKDDLNIPDPNLYTECAPYAAKGPYDVGVTTITIDDLPITIWYPAPPKAAEGKTPETYDLRQWLPQDFKNKIAQDAPTQYTTRGHVDLAIATDQRFPLLIFSHGFAGYRYQSSELTTHLASWGFVVASSEHPERGLAAVLTGNIGGFDSETSNEVVRTVHTQVGLLNMQQDHPLFDRIDMEHVGVIGHSAGGRTAVEVAPDDFVDAVVGLAPAVGSFGGQDMQGANLIKPTLFVVGGKDGITAEEPIRTYYDAQTTPRAYVRLPEAGHLAFSDICVIGREEGGVAQIAVNSGIRVITAIRRLSTDGCKKSDLLPERAWPAIHHFSTAYFRYHLGIDTQLKGFTDRAKTCFDGMVDTIELTEK